MGLPLAEAPLPIDPLPWWVVGDAPPQASKVTPRENGLDRGVRDVAIVGVRDGVARDVVIVGVLGLGCIKAIRIWELACVGIVAQVEDGQAMG